MQLLSRVERETHEVTAHASERLRSSHVLEGSGAAHAYLLEFGPGGFVGAHEASFGHVFVVLDGSGWVAGEDGVRVDVRVGDVVHFARGERHAKGSDSGMRSLMVQAGDLHAV